MLNRPNPSYQITILYEDEEIAVASMPEQIFMASGSEWEPRMAGTLRSFLESQLGGLSRTATTGALASVNFDIVVQSLTYQVWRSSAPIEFNLTLLFDAYKDSIAEVVKPMKTLKEYSLPFAWAENRDLLMPPGPSVVDPNRARISLRIGRFIYIHSVILVNVNNTFDTRLDKNSQPISGQSEVTIRTISTPSRQDVSTFFVSTLGRENKVYGTTQSIIPGLQRGS